MLRITAEDCEQLIPLRGIRLDHGGTAGRLIYLKHDALPGWSLRERAAKEIEMSRHRDVAALSPPST